MKLIEPWLPAHLDLTEEDSGILFNAVDTDEKLEEQHLKKINLEEENFTGLCFSKVYFENCVFLSCTFRKCEFTDVVFKSCNFSNSVFVDTYWNRCQIQSSKGMGANFAGSSIQNMFVCGSSMNYANFDDCKIEKMRTENTELNFSNISDCRVKNLEWDRTQLSRVNFFKTPLKDMDFSTSVIDGLVLSETCQELKGASVDLYQAAELAKRFGIIIK